jgi:circadian clock protein KaiC
MNDRLPTGSDRLDLVLGGGLARNAINLVIGLPGSGKTTLAQQCVYHNAGAEQPALYLSTVSEPMEKILRFGQTLSFFDPAAVGSRVIYEDLGAVVDAGLDDVHHRIRDLLRQYRPGILVIDSFKALHPYASGDREFRRFLHSLAGMLSAYPVTTLWLGEYATDEIATAPEFAVADAIVALESSRYAERVNRALQVMKMRGGGFLSGWHAYRISADGLLVYPRLADLGEPSDYRLGRERISAGVQAIDDMLAEGYWPGASTLVAGPTGSGKTLMGLHFVFSGVQGGETGVIATMQEDPTQLERIAASFSWSLDNVTLMYRTPVDLHIDEWVHDLLDLVEQVGATRVLIDSLGDIQAAALDTIRFREYTYSLLHRCARRGVSVMLTYEVPELFDVNQITEQGASHLVDNVVLLQYKRAGEAIGRTLTVLKTRASDHDVRVREFEISPRGITLVGGETAV